MDLRLIDLFFKQQDLMAGAAGDGFSLAQPL
jgi:hypothetical protein